MSSRDVSDKQQALDIIQASIYSDPMMDEVQMIRDILKNMDQVEASVLIAVSAGVPMELYRSYFSWKITDIVKEASKNFLETLEEEYNESSD
jgi:hypothetical protein